jgi:g-D-glutamyl-meso-diaminopimelate peptidase
MRYLFPGDRGTLVEYLQLALQRAGYPLRIDGIFGDRTCGAVQAFAGDVGGCIVNDELWEKLLPYLKGYTTHQVILGDSIASIARKYQTTQQALLTANYGINPDNLPVGATLTVPYGFSVVPEQVKYSSFLLELIVDGLLARYPYLESKAIGKSVMGKEIPYLKVGNGKKEVCYNASFHANESITTPVLLKFAEDLLMQYAAGGNLSDVSPRRLFEEFSLYLIPIVNPDGVDLVNGILNAGKFYRQAARIGAEFPDIPFPSGWKANIDGIDLNLQFLAGWDNARRIKYAQGYDRPAPRDYVGMAPLTAPESAAVYEFTLEHDFELILAYHTQGEVIYWKYLDYQPTDSYRIARYFGEVSGYAVEETPQASAYAGYKDWFILNYNRPGYTIEAGLGENPLPMSQFAEIYDRNLGILLGGMTEAL